MSLISQNASDVFFQCNQHKASLCLAIKTQSQTNIEQSLINPHIIVAENRIQEAESRKEFLAHLPNPKHFIGHLQKNKIRKALHIFSCIQSVDSLELLYEIERIALEENKKIDVFLSINISEDPNKTGFSVDHVADIVKYIIEHPLQMVRITGLFTILRDGLDAENALFFYQMMKKIWTSLQKIFKEPFQHCSMGMSSDYLVALLAGSTMVRVGSKIFGEREKNEKSEEKK